MQNFGIRKLPWDFDNQKSSRKKIAKAQVQQV